MILKSLMVKSWGCLRTGVSLEDFHEGVNVIHGPNGSGKSTIVNALTRGLFDRHKVRDAKLRDMQPWGSSMGPEVTIEFEQDGGRYRVTKRFLSSQHCELWHRVNEKWEPLADGDSADDRLLEMLQSDRPGSGATQDKHWGMAQLLWLPQGQIWLPADGLNEKSRSRLESVLGEVLITPEFQAILGKVDRYYDEFFTPARADLKAGSEPKELEKKLADARGEADELKLRWDELEGLNQDILRLRAELAEAEEKLNQKRAEHEDASAALNEAKQRANDRKVLERQVQIKERNWREINERVRGIQRLREDLAALRGRQAEQERIYQECSSEFEMAEKKAYDEKKTYDEARCRREEAEGKFRRAQALTTLAGIGKQTEDIKTTLEQLEELSKKRESLEEKLRSLNAPSNRDLKNVQDLHDQLREIQTRLDASSLLIQFKPLMKITGTVSKDGKQESFSLAQQDDKVFEWRAVQSFDIEIVGVGHFSVSSGSGEARDLKAELDEKEQEYLSAVKVFQAENLDELVERNTEAGVLESKIKEIDSQSKVIARDVGSLQKRQRALETQREQILDSYADLEDDKSSEEEAAEARRAAEQELNQASQELQETERRSEEARKTFDEAQKKQNRIESELTRIRVEIEQKENRERELIDDGLTDAQRKENLNNALNELDQDKQRLDQISPVENLTELEAREKRYNEEVKALGAQQRTSESNLNQKRGQLQQAEGEGLYTKLVKAEEEVARLENRYKSALMRANSFKLLHNTLIECREEAMENVFGPVAQRVGEAFRRVAGEGYQEIQFNQQFLPESIDIQGRDVQVSPDALSYGTKEQLNILVRMTLGKILAESESQRQLVILDDPLAHTDADRQRLMLEELQKASEQLQLVILTCHPDHYEELAGKAFDLEELKRADEV